MKRRNFTSGLRRTTLKKATCVPTGSMLARICSGQWNFEVTYGRIGRRGRSVTYSAPDDAAAAAIVRHFLQRWATAPKRIGVPYSIRELRDPHGWSAVSA